MRAVCARKSITKCQSRSRTVKSSQFTWVATATLLVQERFPLAAARLTTFLALPLCSLPLTPLQSLRMNLRLLQPSTHRPCLHTIPRSILLQSHQIIRRQVPRSRPLRAQLPRRQHQVLVPPRASSSPRPFRPLRQALIRPLLRPRCRLQLLQRTQQPRQRLGRRQIPLQSQALCQHLRPH